MQTQHTSRFHSRSSFIAIMDSYTNPQSIQLEAQRQKLNALLQAERPQPSIHPLKEVVSRLGASMVQFLTGQRSLRIWTRTRQGQQVWYVYDTLANRKQQFTSEEDLRIWLDKRYYE